MHKFTIKSSGGGHGYSVTVEAPDRNDPFPLSVHIRAEDLGWVDLDLEKTPEGWVVTESEDKSFDEEVGTKGTLSVLINRRFLLPAEQYDSASVKQAEEDCKFLLYLVEVALDTEEGVITYRTHALNGR